MDFNTPERGGGDPPLDGNTLVERTHSNQHNNLGEVITPCRDKPDAGLDDLPIYWEPPEAAKLFGFNYKDGEGDDVFDGLTVRVEILTEVLRSADGYKRTYSSLQFIHEDKGQEQVMTNNTITHTKIENMKKIFKSHRAALDFDRGFIITSVLTSSNFNWKEELESSKTKNSKRKRK